MDKLSTQTVAEVPSKELSIEELREEIDRLDATILAAVQRRTEISQQIGKARVESGGPKLVHSREIAVLDRYMELGSNGRELGMAILTHSRGRLGHR
jgi:chorismate mutase